jgi:hypothetical protein
MLGRKCVTGKSVVVPLYELRGLHLCHFLVSRFHRSSSAVTGGKARGFLITDFFLVIVSTGGLWNVTDTSLDEWMTD